MKGILCPRIRESYSLAQGRQLKYMKQFGNNSLLIYGFGYLKMELELHLEGVGGKVKGEREMGNLLKLRGGEQ